ncbi:MAG: glycosyltransferase [Planctomycetales bacterium]|nr:glycosyltransferase [Planctomycetales bacterium]
MRIALIITELNPGGAEKCFTNLACFLKQAGHSVAVWQLGPPPREPKKILTRQLEQHGIAWHSGSARHAWHFPQTVHWLRSEMKAFRPEVVQSFLFHANLAAVLASGSLPCRRFGGARVRQPEPWRQWLQRWAAGRMEKLICVSNSVADHCHLREKIARDRLLVIPNGIALPQSSEPPPSWQQFGLPAGAPVLLFVGRLTAQKGIREFLQRCAAELLAQLPGHHLVLMGDGELAPALEKIRHRCAAGGRIHLIGWQDTPQRWIRASELLLLPARYEGMPNALLEAMAVAKPLVSFDVDGVRELLGEGAAAEAQIAPAQDFAALTRTLVALASAPRQLQQCGQHNRRRIEQHFQLQQQLERYLHAYVQPGSSSGT